MTRGPEESLQKRIICIESLGEDQKIRIRGLADNDTVFSFPPTLLITTNRFLPVHHHRSTSPIGSIRWWFST